MTYWQFHIVFTLPLFACVLFFARNNPLTFSKKGLLGTATLLFLALSYTTPWDSYLIHQEIWTYEPGRVLGTLFKIPFEEFFFFIIQTIIGCFFSSLLLIRFKTTFSHGLTVHFSQLLYVLIALAASASLYFLQPMSEFRYLFLVLIWALPILFMQWLLGWSVLKAEWRTWVLGVSSLTLYFWLADSFAISKGIWAFPEGTISGIEILGLLPIEEALFFLVTNLMVVQGYILFTTVDFNKFRLRLPSKGRS
jgi:lycopene cyclase domain-containing protein